MEGLPETNAPYIAWHGESDRTADSLISAPTQGVDDHEARREAKDFLRTALANGPRLAAALLREGERCGIAVATLNRAKADLGIKSDRIGGIAGKGEWKWYFPSATA